MRRVRVTRASYGLVGLLLAICLASCASTQPSSLSSTTSTTTTTTTLPRSAFIRGSNIAGSLASLGPIWRVPVPLLGAGVDAPAKPVEPPAAPPDTVRIGYRQFGSGPDLLLVMGQHGSMSWWDPKLLSDLAGHYRVTIFDLPGVGYSAPTRPLSIVNYADVTAGLVYSLALTSPSVLGWGLGGDVALALAERHPDFVSHLVLVDTSAGGTTSTPPGIAVKSLLGSPLATTAQLSSLFFPHSELEARAGWLTRIAPVPPDDVVATAIHSEAVLQSQVYARDDLLTGLSALTTPTLVVVGALDQVVPPHNGETLAHALRHGALKVFADAGYGALFQDEPQFFTLVTNFTSKTTSTSTSTTSATSR